MKVFLIAGEASGDKLGAALMIGLKHLRPDIQFFGIGGPQMQAQGLTSLFPMEELSVMGLVEVLPRLRSLFRRRDQAANSILKLKPDALITIDSPDFCLRVAKKVRKRQEIPVIHYVAPSVWVWREGRAAKMAQHVDHVLALLPFEPPYMRAVGMTCDFVGHPVTAEPQPKPDEIAALRAELNIPPENRVLVILLGSRSGEVARLSEHFGASIALLNRNNLSVVVPTVGHLYDQVAEAVQDWPFQVTLLDPRDFDAAQAEARKRSLFHMADAGLAASGTVGLELGMAGCPSVIAYRMAPLSWFFVKRLVKTKYVNLINILLQRSVVPELIQHDCTAANIASALRPILDRPEVAAAQRDGLIEAMVMLGTAQDAPGLRAARSVLAAVQRHSNN
ncbi:lipid-A-disaccharide synthase [Monaibacterium marinum]|uniref:Lipid-A-disaccharide synthase n=2 Tax=Pontivivens marinum TaxID=1690039 RepID=A0A2C9CQH5_9RHOB|nr:lipid-A-disaccharide synthase [Monaibacterium marinum]